MIQPSPEGRGWPATALSPAAAGRVRGHVVSVRGAYLALYVCASGHPPQPTDCGARISSCYNLPPMAITGFSGLRILLVVSLCGTLVQGQQISEPKPIWSTDLRQAGYVPDPGFRSFFFTFSTDPRRTISQVSDDAVAFGGGSHLAVAFLTQEIGGKHRSFDSVDASRELHIILLDAATGRILVNRTWPGQQASSSKAYATKDGDFVLLHGNALYVYSPDLQQISRVDVPADAKVFGGGWSPLVRRARIRFSFSTTLEVAGACECSVRRPFGRSAPGTSH